MITVISGLRVIKAPVGAVTGFLGCSASSESAIQKEAIPLFKHFLRSHILSNHITDMVEVLAGGALVMFSGFHISTTQLRVHSCEARAI